VTIARGDDIPMDAPLVERRRHPIFPPVQALALYVFVVVVVAIVTYGISERNDSRLEQAKATADYERCVAGTHILKIGNDQAKVLREVVTNIIEGRESAAKIAATPTERRIAARSAEKYRALLADIKEYPTFECYRDGTRRELDE
jgi:hypothetical protein